MKKVLATVVLLAMMCVFAGCGNKKGSDEIVLDQVGGYIYTWKCEIKNEEILISAGEEYESEPIEGGNVTVHFNYTGVKKGSTTITCNYSSGNDIDKTQKYKAVVDKDLNVTIYEK
ncbi:MAG: protease inhibitor I42 family protein [Bacilli bacterium]|nr:protease inhibitor I42 family protein [Bacilli bacterium]